MAKRTKEQLAKKLQAWIKKHGGPTASLSAIRPNPDNPRTITEDALHKLCCQLADMPQTLQARCIVYDEQGIILGGNMRYAALGELGIAEVPQNWLYCAKGLSEKQKQQFILLDNTGAGQWNWDILANEWDSDLIADWGPVVPGWDVSAGEEEEQHLEAAEDDYDVPAGGLATDIMIGDLFEIGPHRLLCGDSTDSDAVEKLLNGEAPRLMITDPTYGVSYDANWRNEADRANGKPYGAVAIGKVSNDDNADWRDAYSISPSLVAYVWHPPGAIQKTFAQNLEDCGFEIRMTIIWAKSHFPIGRGHYHVKHEPCYYAVKKGHNADWLGDRKQTTIWEIDKPRKSETGHSTQKPIECMAKPMQNHGGDVYDPFLGSGTTMVAAHQLNRKCYGMELEPKYCQVIVDRMLKLDPSLSLKRNGKPYKPTQP